MALLYGYKKMIQPSILVGFLLIFSFELLQNLAAINRFWCAARGA